jgi:hypothetical protein
MSNDVKMMGLAALGIAALIWYMTKGKAPAPALGTNNLATPGTPDQIINPSLQGQPGYGWRYFTDGTAIDPQGNYYFQGTKVWDASTGAAV